MKNPPCELNIEHCFVVFAVKIDVMKSILVDIHTADILPVLKYIEKVMKWQKKETHKYHLPPRALNQGAADSITTLLHSLYDAWLSEGFSQDRDKH